MGHTIDRTMVYSPGLERLQQGGITGISGYTRISKVQYVTGAGQSLYQEWDDDVTMSVKVWNVYIGAMLGMGSGPTEGVDIR